MRKRDLLLIPASFVYVTVSSSVERLRPEEAATLTRGSAVSVVVSVRVPREVKELLEEAGVDVAEAVRELP